MFSKDLLTIAMPLPSQKNKNGGKMSELRVGFEPAIVFYRYKTVGSLDDASSKILPCVCNHIMTFLFYAVL